MAIGAAANMVILHRNPLVIRWRKTRTTTPLPPPLVNFNLSNWSRDRSNLKLVNSKLQIRSAAAVVTIPEPEPKEDHEYGSSNKRGLVWCNVVKGIMGKGLMRTAAVFLLLLMYSHSHKGRGRRMALAASPPVKLEVGRVHAAWDPLEYRKNPAKDRHSVSLKRFRASQDKANFKKVKAIWNQLQCAKVYYSVAVLLLLLLVIMQVVPSVNKYINYLPLVLIWLLAHSILYGPSSTVFKLQLQINLSNSGRALQSDLNQIAQTAADTSSSYEGLNTILTETVLAITRHPDCFNSATSYVTHADEYGFNGAKTCLDNLSMQERIKFYEKALVDVNNIITKGSTSHNSPSQIEDECMEVTVLVAVDGEHELLTIHSGDDLKKALQKLASMDTDDTLYVFGVEVLWNPRLPSSRTRYLKISK